MSEHDPARLDADRRALDAMAVRLAHDDPRFDTTMRNGYTPPERRLRRGLVRALVTGMVMITTTTLLAGAGAGLVVGLVAGLVTTTAVALHQRR